MRRREFLSLSVGAAVGWPLTAHAQPRKVPTIGVLVVGAPGSEQFWRLFRADMAELGYVEGQNIRYEFRSDQGQINRLGELATELVRLNVDVIVTWFTPAAQAAKAATREIPIVAFAGDPVATGLVDSLNRPGGNVTGMSGVNAQLGGKCVELIREMLPSAHRVVALANAPDPFSKPFVEQIRTGGTAVGIVIEAKMLNRAEELEAAFLDMDKERPDAVVVQPSLSAKRAAELAAKYRLPAISTLRSFAEQGGLMSYAAVLSYLYQRAAVYVDKILKGARPDNLPVEQPKHFELIINMKTAKTLGLTMPSSLLARADEVIE